MPAQAYTGPEKDTMTLNLLALLAARWLGRVEGRNRIVVQGLVGEHQQHVILLKHVDLGDVLRLDDTLEIARCSRPAVRDEDACIRAINQLSATICIECKHLRFVRNKKSLARILVTTYQREQGNSHD